MFPHTEEYITKSITVNENHKDEIISNYQVFYYIELPKFRKAMKGKNIILDNVSSWLTFIDGENKKGVEEVVKNNEVIKKASKQLEYLTGEEEIQRIAELIERGSMEKASARESGYIDGKEDGILIGKKEAQKETKLEIIKSMYREKFDIETISKITKINVDEIKKILSIK